MIYESYVVDGLHVKFDGDDGPDPATKFSALAQQPVIYVADSVVRLAEKYGQTFEKLTRGAGTSAGIS